MKKYILLPLLTVLVISSTIHAGELDQRLIVGVSVGVGSPSQNFGKSDTIGRKDTTKVKGWATTGITFSLKAGYRLTKHIGIMAQGNANINGFNASAYQNQYYNIPILQGSVAINATPYYIGSYLAGPFFNFPLGSWFTLEAHVLAGLMTAKYSNLNPVIVFDGSTYNYTISYKPADAFGYDFGAGLKFKIIDQIGITLSGDYLGGAPTFSRYTVDYTGPSVPPPGAPPASNGSPRTSVMSTGLFNINVGAVFSFF